MITAMQQADSAVRVAADRLRGRPAPQDALPLARDYLCALVRRGLEVDVDAPLDPTRPLSELGVDSLLTFELLDLVEQEFRLGLVVEDVSVVPSVDELARGLVEQLTGAADG